MSCTDAVDRLEGLMQRRNELARRAAAAPSAARLQELRAWQATRLAATYADLQRDPLAGAALRFFLSDLYGSQDLSRRDQDFGRAWGLLKRALPSRMLQVLSTAIELDVLSAELDLEMTARLPPGPLSAQTYSDAYRAVGRLEARRRQIGLIAEVGNALVRAVQTPFVGIALRAAHGPAHAAGFGVLQDFLERGFAAFRELRDPDRFLATIEGRELRLLQTLEAGGTISAQGAPAEAAGSISAR